MTHPEPIEFVSAILVRSRQAGRLASFYRDTLGLPLAEERHGDASPHWGCELGDVHFAIHPDQDALAPGPIRLAFWVFGLENFTAHLQQRGIPLRYPIRQLGPNSLVTAIVDPDGNEIELTQMGGDWLQHLADRRKHGADVITRGGEPSSA